MAGVMAPTAATTPAMERDANPSIPTATPIPMPQPAMSQPAASQFGQFRLTTFVDANPNSIPKAAAKGKSKSGSASATQSPVVRPSSEPAGVEGRERGREATGALAVVNGGDVGVAAVNGNANGENEAPMSSTAATAHKRTTSVAAAKIPHNQHNGFGVLDLAPALPAPGQGKLGNHRDGRVRNPVPRKLKGKTDMRNGNFSVMHMDMSNHATDGRLGGEGRGEAAKRTSENTAKAAREALREKQGGGGGVKRRRVDGEGAWEPILSQASQVAPMQAAGSANGMQGIAPMPPKEIVHRTEGMTPEEVKYEQARLLTLLRSLNPLAVVDQMCTALAFFGGIPGAPPPDQGVGFPESEDANGNGALFVGWLSEIFPDAQRRQWSGTRVAESEQSVPQGKRPRGRPKGSKASKVRKDKGIKKGRKDGLPSNASQPPEDGDDPADDEWVDIGIGDNEAGPSGGNAHADGRMIVDLDGVDGTPSQAAGKRKVGRPRGSRNKDKDHDVDGNEIPSVDDANSLSSPSQQNQNHMEGHSFSAFETQESPNGIQKRKPGRPTGSKTKPKEGAPPPPPPAPKATKAKPQLKDGPTPTRAKSVLDGSMPPGLAADERAILEAYRKNKALAGPEKADDPQKKKRKSRAKPKPAPADGAAVPGGDQAVASDTPTMLAQQLNFAPEKQQTPVQSTTAVPPPPAKRQRKGKELARTTSGATNSAAPKATNNTPNIDPSLRSGQPMSASPHLQNPQSQTQQPQPQPQSRIAQQPPPRSMSASHAGSNPFANPPVPSMGSSNISNTLLSIEPLLPSLPSSSHQPTSGRTAQGLEAHYERFANQDSASQSHSPGSYGLGQRASMSQAVPQGMQRANSAHSRQGGGMTRSPQKSNLGNVGASANLGNNTLYYAQSQSQPLPQQQMQRHSSAQGQRFGYDSAMPQPQQAARANSYALDAFGQPRNGLGSSMPSATGGVQRGAGGSGYGVQHQGQANHQHHPQHQNQVHGQNQQQTGYFDTGVSGAYVDLPALETGYGAGSAGAGGNGNGVGGARSASYSAGAGMGGGGLFEGGAGGGGITDGEMRESLLRGIGRR